MVLRLAAGRDRATGLARRAFLQVSGRPPHAADHEPNMSIRFALGPPFVETKDLRIGLSDSRAVL